MKKLILGMAALVLLAACASKDVKEQKPAPVEEAKPSIGVVKPPPPPPPPVTPKVTPVAPATVTGSELNNPNSILYKKSVYFDYDSFVVKDEFKPMVTAHAQYLSKNRGARMVIQGNTDERGSREYNLALGQRRADSVKQMMLLLGAQEAQIETVSFGEEKPRAQGNDEKAFAENRRGDIVYTQER